MSAECAICCEYLQSHNALAAITCGHVFHHRCLREWFGRSLTCPQCKCYIRDAMVKPLHLNLTADDAATTRNVESRIVKLQRKLDMQDAELAANRMTNEALTPKVETQSRRSHEYVRQNDQLRMELNQLRSQLTSKTEDAEMALEWLKAREDKIRYLEDSAKADKNAYEVALEQQDKLIEELTAKCSALETSKRKLEVDLEKRESEMEVQKHQQKLIEKLEADLEKRANESEIADTTGELTARCSALETSNRKLESELEKRVNEISILQKSRTMKEEPLSPTNLVLQQREKEIATVPAVKEEPASSTELASKPKRASRKALSAIDLNTDTQAARRKQGYLKRPR